MTANIEVKTLVVGGARNAADVNRVRLQDGDRDLVFREEITRGQPGRTRADHCDGGFHFAFKRPSFPE